MKRILGIFLGMLVISLLGCGNRNETQISEYCWEQVSESLILNENSDGSVVVELMAPDYAKLIQNIVNRNNNVSINVNTLSKELEESPNIMKKYIIFSTTADEEDIKSAFNDQVAKELTIAAISRADYTVEWEAGE